jgi:MoxR-like ATPase
MSTETENIEQLAEEFRVAFAAVKAEIQKVIVGHVDIVEAVLGIVFTGGHCLLEGVPGLGKTLLVRTLSEVLDLDFSRVQFTPDLMPADILGTELVIEDESGQRAFRFRKGPIFSQIVLADEINRATPKTQSALLESMQEGSVTVAGERHELDQPFFVLATQNPIEQEGTYPLPEAQLDRFLLKLVVGYSNREELSRILDLTTAGEREPPRKIMGGAEILRWRALVRRVVIAPHVKDYAVRLVLATHPGSPFAAPATERSLRFGSSPRGAQALVLSAKLKALLAGRLNVAFEDLRQMAHAALRHRIILNFEAEAEGLDADGLLDQIIADVPEQEPAETSP